MPFPWSLYPSWKLERWLASSTKRQPLTILRDLQQWWRNCDSLYFSDVIGSQNRLTWTLWHYYLINMHVTILIDVYITKLGPVGTFEVMLAGVWRECLINLFISIYDLFCIYLIRIFSNSVHTGDIHLSTIYFII